MLIIAGILAAVVIPSLNGSSQTYNALGFYDSTKAALRYAQKSAIAKRRTVCVAFTANGLTVTFASAFGPNTCDTNLTGPAGENPYTITSASGSGYAAVPTNFNFNPSGQPVDTAAGLPLPTQTITFAGAKAITVNADTGYVQ